MKKVLSSLLAVALMFTMLMPITASAATTVTAKVSVTESYTNAYEVLKLVNAERKKVGAPALKMDSSLLESAMVRAAEIVVYYSHTRPNGTLCFTINDKMYAENIGCNQTSPKAVMTSWMNSTGHRTNIQNKDYKTIGIGAVKYNGHYYWVQAFGYSGNSTTRTGSATKTRSFSATTDKYELSLTQSSYTVAMNETQKMTGVSSKNTGFSTVNFTVNPEVMNFTSSNTSVFTVDTAGVIHPKKIGSATLTSTLKGDSSKKVSQKVTIVKPHTYKTTLKKATTSSNGSIVKTCTDCGKSVKSTIYAASKMSLSSTSYTYNAKPKRPKVTVKGSNGSTISSSYYTVKYYNCSTKKTSTPTNPGKYYAKVTLKGNYSGSKNLYFTIKPKSTTVSKVSKPKSKQIKVTWKKQTTRTSGYQIQYSTSSKFTSSTTKTTTVSKNSTTSKTIKSLKSKKKYYVRVRTYKNVKISGKTTKICSSWSKSKSITTK